MPKCKALAAGGSRRCRRNALKGQEFCSYHGGLNTKSRNNRSRSLTQSRSAPVRTHIKNNKSIPSGSPLGQSSRRRLNPAFTRIGISNPLIQMLYYDKVSDMSRSTNVALAMNVATMPLLAFGPAGFGAKVATSLIGTILISSYLHKADLYRDMSKIMATGKIHGYSIMGETHN